MFKVSWLVWLVWLAAGCGHPHVRLEPPPPNLTPDQRVHAFHALKAVGAERIITTQCGQGGCTSSEHNVLLLANGQRIHHPEDLVPVIPANSSAAVAVERARAARSTGHRWGYIGFGSFTVGGLLALQGFDAEPNSVRDTAVPILLVGGIVAAGFAWYYIRESNTQTRTAYWHYSGALAQQLGICVVGLQVVACDQPPTAAAP